VKSELLTACIKCGGDGWIDFEFYIAELKEWDSQKQSCEDCNKSGDVTYGR
tara:strand:- start:3176 stop:3328 length:153 start_codon:yes stop_codon:yes gene_type:complete